VDCKFKEKGRENTNCSGISLTEAVGVLTGIGNVGDFDAVLKYQVDDFLTFVKQISVALVEFFQV
jgi:hypothetical protein